MRWQGQPRGWVSAVDSGAVASQEGPAEVLIWVSEQAGLEREEEPGARSQEPAGHAAWCLQLP